MQALKDAAILLALLLAVATVRISPAAPASSPRPPAPQVRATEVDPAARTTPELVPAPDPRLMILRIDRVEHRRPAVPARG